ncbi:MAG: hypothetical protein GY778_29325, partial [bacterium]|nr:hypothetical protein [bacterium]
MMAACLFALAPILFGQTADLTHVDRFTDGLEYPARLAAVSGGGIYVTDPPNAQIIQLDALGAAVGTFPIPEGPVGIAVHPGGQIFVSRGDDQVGIYDAAFSLTGTLDVTGSPFVLDGPNDLAVHPVTGEVYVANSGGHNVLVFDGTTGLIVGGWGVAGSGLSEFQAPQAIAIDANLDHVIVADVDNYRVQVFDTAGALQFKFGYRILYVGMDETAWFARTEGVGVDSCGNIYLADALMGTIRAFSPMGAELDPTLTPLVGYGANPGELATPVDLMIDGADRMFVANGHNAAVEVFAVTCTASRAAPA